MSKEKTISHKGIAAATLTVAGAFVAPHAMAVSDAQYRADMEAMMKKVEALENQLKTVEKGTASQSPKVQELDEWMSSVKSAPIKSTAKKENMVFVRGGYSAGNEARGNFQGLNAGEDSDIHAGRGLVDDEAWYFGAGVDFSLTDDLFGMVDDTELLAELMVDYKELSDNKVSEYAAFSPGLNGDPLGERQRVTVSQLTFAASPKIKFLKGSAFRPWLIPIGFEVNIISPPTGAFTSLTPGIQFGAGADYRVWKDIYVGADARYHYTTGDIEGVDIDGVTAGGYLGVGF